MPRLEFRQFWALVFALALVVVIVVVVEPFLCRRMSQMPHRTRVGLFKELLFQVVENLPVLARYWLRQKACWPMKEWTFTDVQ